MATTTDAWQAGIDAVVADNTLTRAGFVDAIQTVLTSNFTNVEGNAWVDAVAAEFDVLGIINNPTYNNLRGHIIADAVVHRSLFDALSTLGQLPEIRPAEDAAELITLREERDNVDAAIDRLDVLIANEPAGPTRKLVRDVLRQGKEQLRAHKQDLRNRIQQITGDPDS